MEPLKEMFNAVFYEKLAEAFYREHKDFRKSAFVKEVTTDLNSLELNQRLRRTTEVLKNHLPEDYEKALTIMKKVAPKLKPGYTNLIFPDFVGLYGKKHFSLSMGALKFFTAFGSSEFAIREFLKLDFERSIKIMYTWARDKDLHVRRLASEGSRPRLPWSFKLDRVIQSPEVTLPIIETLIADKELYVKKSVANHLNDISKDHPDFVLKLIRKHKGQTAHTDWILKHAARTMLKAGNKEALALFDIVHNENILLSNFKVLTKKIKVGGHLEFGFDIQNIGNEKLNIRAEYLICFKSNGNKFSKKIFKIGEYQLGKKQVKKFIKRHSFKKISTRKYHLGIQKISPVINGKEGKAISFELL
jgi:3-methyladenine DNA glycosylase AlkC